MLRTCKTRPLNARLISRALTDLVLWDLYFGEVISNPAFTGSLFVEVEHYKDTIRDVGSTTT